METQYRLKSPSPDKPKIPKDLNIKPATEQGFNIEDCMKDLTVDQKDTFQHDPDYYFDSYAHFSIHEEMLKDRVMNTPPF
jgi:hypothetical protein